MELGEPLHDVRVLAGEIGLLGDVCRKVGRTSWRACYCTAGRAATRIPAPPTVGTLAELDPAQLVTPPKGYEVGYVTIAARQEVDTSCSVS